MAEENQFMNVKPFNGGNGFSNWEFRVRLILEQKNVLKTITEDPPTDQDELSSFIKNDVKARNIIVQCLSDNLLETIKDKKSAKDIMDTLKRTYLKKGIANQVQLQKKLRNMKFNPSESLNSFLTEFEKTVHELKNSGGQIQNSEVITQLLSAMPESYQSVTTAIDVLFCQEEDRITLDFVKNKLLMEEARQCKNKSEKEGNVQHAFAGFQRKPTVKSIFKNKDFPFKCYNCGKRGHKKADCTLRKSADYKSKSKCNLVEKKDDEIAFMVSSDEIVNDCEILQFVVDSGATNHLISSKYGFLLENSEEVYHKISVAKIGESIIARKKGELHVQTIDGKFIKLENVLECENLSKNLLSVKRIEEKDFQIVFEKKKIAIKRNGETVSEGELCGNLYVINFYMKIKEVNLTVKNETLLHRRMGHSSKFPSSEFCEVCTQGKQTRQPFKRINEDKKAKRILEVISSDVCGPITPATHDGKRYFCTFIDNFSHFGMCYLLETKSEVLTKFKTYASMIEAKFHKKIERLRCDNGGEYSSKEFKNFCMERGIKIQYTIPYNPEQNGVAERYNRSIMEKARCLIFDANIDKKFWGEAVRTSVYLLNRIPTSMLPETTPAEIWYNCKPNMEKIKVFGCNAFCFVPKEDRNGKLDSRSIKMVMMGYTENGYLLWHPDKEKMVSARNVIFDENCLNRNYNQRTILDNDLGDRNDDSYQVRNEQEEIHGNIQDEENMEKNRRSMRHKKLPKHLEDYEVEIMMALTVGEMSNGNVPETFTQALKEGWKEAVDEELSSHRKNHTWELVPTPSSSESIIDSKWVFQEKIGRDGVVKKARLVARGFLQSDLTEEVYAPVARTMTIRLLLSLAVRKNMHILQLDVKSAFLNGILKKPIYMKIPEGLEGNTSGKVCKLLKALYGLRQSPKCWNDKLHEKLVSFNLIRSKVDPCLYFNQDVYLLVYVDDLFLVSKSFTELKKVKEKLMENFEMKDLSNGKNFRFLGIDINRTENKLILCQQDLICKILKIFGMTECKTLNVPVQPKLNLTICSSEIKRCELPYKELIGYLMYLMLCTRPDICFAVTYFSQFQNCYNENHWKQLKCILKYLKCTKNYGLILSKSVANENTIETFVDADFANNVNDRKSVSGFVIKVFNNTVFWKSKKQTVVSLSTAEAEYIAMSAALTESIFISQLLEEILDIPVYPITVYEDNQSCLKMASTLETKRSKHIDVRHHFIKDLVSKGRVNLCYIPTNEQIADLFTKSLCFNKFQYFRDKIDVCNIAELQGGVE